MTMTINRSQFPGTTGSSSSSCQKGTIKILSFRQGEYEYVKRTLERMRESGSLPSDGKLRLISEKESNERLERAWKELNRLHCDNGGELKVVGERVLKELGAPELIKGAAVDLIGKRLGHKKEWVISALWETPGDTVKRIGEHVLNKQGFGAALRAAGKANYLVLLQRVFEGGRADLNDHRRQCQIHAASLGAALEDYATPIATFEIVKTQPQPEQREKPSRVQWADEEGEPLVDVRTIPAPETIEESSFGLPTTTESTPPEIPVTPPQVELFGSAVLNPLCPKESTVTLGVKSEGCSVGGTINPSRLKQSTLFVDAPLNEDSEASITFNPQDIRSTRITLQTKGDEGNCGLVVNPSDPKKSRINVAGEVEGYRLGVSIAPHKPLKSEISGSAVVPIYGVPVQFSARSTLRNPEKAEFSAALPLGVVTIPIASIKVKNVIKAVRNPIGEVKSQIKRAKRTIKKCEKFGRKITGRKKKKKSKRAKQEALQQRMREFSLQLSHEDQQYWEHQIEVSLAHLSKELANLTSSLATLPKLRIHEREVETYDSILEQIDELEAKVHLIEEGTMTFTASSDSLVRAVEALQNVSNEFKEKMDAYLSEAEKVADALAASKDAGNILGKTIDKMDGTAVDNLRQRLSLQQLADIQKISDRLSA